jgi:hypothetical protein
MTMETSAETTAFRTAADRLSGTTDVLASLNKRPRPFEDFIRLTLFLCGLVSVLTTVGIIVVLSTEAINFFTRYGFRSSEQLLVKPIDAESTVIELDGTGAQPRVGQVIRINEEDMRVTRIISPDRPTILEVERGVLNTRPEPHNVNATMFLGEQVSVIEFLTGTRWVPQGADFGVLALVMATLITSTVAMLVAGPVGLGAAIFISEYANARLRAILKPILEVLAAIPTVVYGYFALTLITPTLRNIFWQSEVGAYNQLSAGLAMGIMIIPTIASSERRCAQRSAAQLARRQLRSRRHTPRDCLPRLDSCRTLWHPRRVHSGHLARCRRDHDRGNCLRRRSELRTQSARSR